MDSDLKEFIRQEQVKLSNIQSGLTARQRTKLLPKINQIRFLLKLLANEGNVISKKDKEELEKRIDKATDDAQESARAEQIRTATNASLINRVRPNVDSVPEAVRQKAIMVKASSLFDVAGDKNSVNDFLEENGVDYKVSDRVESTGESLVLENKFDPTDVKVAFRGSKMNNLQDWISNAKMAVGQEEKTFVGEKDAIGEARAKVQEVENVYGNKANELLGHSRGGAIALNLGDSEGIDTTTFNAFIGKNLSRASESTAQHTLWRTTEDLPSVGIGFRQNQNNIKINVVRPLKDSLNPVESHKLKNFTEKKPRATEDDPNLIENLIKNNINEPVAKHAEAENIHRAISFKDNKGRILESRDPYNARAKGRQEAGGIGHNVNDPKNYEIGEQILALPAPPPNQTPTEQRVDKMLSDEMAFSSEIADFKRDIFGLSDTEDIKNSILSDTKNSELEVKATDFTTTTDITPEKISPLQKVKDRANVIKQKLNVLQETISEPKERFVLGPPLTKEDEIRRPFEPPKQPKRVKLTIKETGSLAQEVPDTLDTQLKKTQREYESKLSQKRQGEDISDESLEELKDKLMRLRNQRTIQRQAEREPSFKDFVKEVKPNDIDINGKLSNNITSKSKVASIWKKIGGKFTDDELSHLNSNPTPAGEEYNFSLDDEDIADLVGEDSKEARHKIVKDYEQKVHDGIKNVDDVISIEDNMGQKRSITGELTGGLSAVNLGVGLGAAYTTDKLINKIDPNLDPDLKTGISGAVSGGIGETAALTLSGAGAGIGASGGLLLAPAVIAGAAGNIAGMETFKGVKKLGGTDFEAETAAGGAGGLAAGLTAGGLMAALSAGGIAGATAAAPADLETFGLASLGAGIVGAGIGATSYLGQKEFGAIEKQIKKTTGATDLEAELGAGAGTGATIGGVVGTIFGGPVGTAAGAVVGGGIGGIAALAKYGIDKLF